MARLWEKANQLMQAAANGAAAGGSQSAMTILIGPRGQIHMIADSQWSLDRLQEDRGAHTAYRVSRQQDRVRVEARNQLESCVLESESPNTSAQRLFAKPWPYEVVKLL